MAIRHQNVLGQNIKTFTFISALGQGAFSKVYEAIDQRDNNQVAIKAIPKQLMVQTPKLQELVKTQIKVLKSCSSQNIIKYIDSFTSSKTVFIATQFCNGGDLQKYLQDKKRLTQDQATQFLKQILNGFKGLHQIGAMHRDFKLANVLIHNGICKIADLGFSKQLKQPSSVTNTILGTSLTMAPQVLEERPYGMQADLWSIGVVYYQMIYGKYPYTGMNDLDLLRRIKNNRPKFEGVIISRQCRDFIDKCLTVDPKKRIKWSQVYNHQLLIKSQGRFIYHALNLKMDLQPNKQYYRNYKNQFQIQKNNYLDVKWQDGGQIRQSMNINNLVQQKRLKQNKVKNFNRYQRIYINKRNSIMFIFKFVCPYVDKLFKIKANHGISLFIMSKKAYIDTKQHLKKLKQKNNIFDFKQNWIDFFNSPQYLRLIRQSEDDLQIIGAQALSYSYDIQIMSKQIQSQLNIQNIKSKNWNKLLHDTINQYWFLLAQGIDLINPQHKYIILTVLQALDYYRQNKIADVDSFANKMEVLNITQTQQKIKRKIIESYQ